MVYFNSIKIKKFINRGSRILFLFFYVDFTECANDAYCAGRAVNGYMDKYAQVRRKLGIFLSSGLDKRLMILQDCNGDGVIDCADYARIHKLGAFGCTADLDEEFEDTFNDCIKVFE